MENYTPKVHENGKYVEMLLETKKCHLCDKIMVRKTSNKLFPMYYKINQEEQRKAGGFVYESAIYVDNKPICLECADAGKADFLCTLCSERKPSFKLKESIGYPAEFLCNDCYETKSAKIWEEEIERLREEHRYDFE